VTKGSRRVSNFCIYLSEIVSMVITVAVVITRVTEVREAMNNV
jgi:hypothetical protein